jgi:hypothetical protein
MILFENLREICATIRAFDDIFASTGPQMPENCTKDPITSLGARKEISVDIMPIRDKILNVQSDQRAILTLCAM